MLKFVCPLITVDDIAASRHFYELLLGQRVKDDFGVNVAFEGNFAIHLKTHFQGLLGEAARFPVTQKAHNGELYFESDEVDAIYQRLTQAQVEFAHPVQEQPWGQRVMRFYDPDGHVIEIGEQMEAVVMRYYELGSSPDQIHEKTAMSVEFVEQAIRQAGKAG